MELITIDNNIAILDTETAQNIAEIERMIKKLKDIEESNKTAILEEMEQKGIKQIDDEINGLTITYVAPYDKETFKTKEFKTDHADLYDEYVKMSPVKASVRIKVK